MKVEYIISVGGEDVAQFRDEALAQFVYQEMLNVYFEGEKYLRLRDADGRTINDNTITRVALDGSQ